MKRLRIGRRLAAKPQPEPRAASADEPDEARDAPPARPAAEEAWIRGGSSREPVSPRAWLSQRSRDEESTSTGLESEVW